MAISTIQSTQWSNDHCFSPSKRWSNVLKTNFRLYLTFLKSTIFFSNQQQFLNDNFSTTLSKLDSISHPKSSDHLSGSGDHSHHNWQYAGLFVANLFSKTASSFKLSTHLISSFWSWCCITCDAYCFVQRTTSGLVFR